MENLSSWQIIKIGFLLGVGFVIPSLVSDSLVMGISFGAASSAFEEMEVENSNNEVEDETYPELVDLSEKIVLGSHTSHMQGKQLLISGQLTNSGSEIVKSIEIEAELFDKNGVFVYECSEYINSQLSPGKNENYQIKCGCSKNGLPDYATMKLSVKRAMSY